MLPQPRSGRLVAWGNAYLAGHTSLDEAAMRAAGDDGPHRVTGIPGEDGEAALTLALGRLRALGARCLRLVLPVPGDPSGLPGPPEFNMDAVTAGEAVLIVGPVPLGLVPYPTTYGPVGDQETWVRWTTLPVAPAPTTPGPSLSEAEQQLKKALLDASDELDQLDVARWRPEAAEALAAIRAHGREPSELLPPGYPPKAVRVLTLAQRVHAIAALAEEDPGAAVGAHEMAARSAVLRPLGRYARHAQVAAYNVLAESRPPV